MDLNFSCVHEAGFVFPALLNTNRLHVSQITEPVRTPVDIHVGAFSVLIEPPLNTPRAGNVVGTKVERNNFVPRPDEES